MEQTPNNDFLKREPLSKSDAKPRDSEKQPSPNLQKDFAKVSDKKRPSAQKRIRRIGITLAACLLMGIVGYKYAGKLLPQPSHQLVKMTVTTEESLPPTKPNLPPISQDDSREAEIAQAVEFLDLQRQNQRQVQLIRNLKDQLNESYQRLDDMKGSLSKQKRMLAVRKKDQQLEDSLKEQIALAQQQLEEKGSDNQLLQDRLQKLQKQYDETQSNLCKHQEGNATLTQRFNQVQKHLQKAQEELLEQSSENERLVSSINALQAELATTAIQLKEKEQLSKELAKKTATLQEHLTLATQQITQKDKELALLNAQVQKLYDEQNRLQETLTERDSMTNRLLAKVKKLKNTLDEREREAYVQALEQLSSTKRSFKNATAARQRTHDEVDLDHFIENTSQPVKHELHEEPHNEPAPQRGFQDLVYNNSQKLADNADSAPFFEEVEIEKFQPKQKNLSAIKKKQNDQSSKKTQQLGATSQPTQKKKLNQPGLGSKAKKLAAARDDSSIDELTRELDLEKEKIQELEKSLQKTLHNYETTKKQMKSMHSGLSFGE